MYHHLLRSTPNAHAYTSRSIILFRILLIATISTIATITTIATIALGSPAW
jgi:hypothetical protein